MNIGYQKKNSGCEKNKIILNFLLLIYLILFIVTWRLTILIDIFLKVSKYRKTI